jgi:hypothetical protein
MKDLDFIPDWYRADQRRRRRCHRMYALLGMLLLVLIGLNVVMGRHVSRVSAEVATVQAVIDAARQRVDEAADLQNEIMEVDRKAVELKAVAPRTKTSAVMAELSHITAENIVLSKLQFRTEPVEKTAARQMQTPGAVVRTGPAGSSAQQAAGPDPVRTKVVLNGIAFMPADAAAMIYRLEQSAYFEQVVPVFTRAKKMKHRDVTEFEIQCYVADYRLE